VASRAGLPRTAESEADDDDSAEGEAAGGEADETIFPFSSIQINYSYRAKRHVDGCSSSLPSRTSPAWLGLAWLGVGCRTRRMPVCLHAHFAHSV
jgi:hypothetical protein